MHDATPRIVPAGPNGVTVHAAGPAASVELVRAFIRTEQRHRFERDREHVRRVLRDVPGRRRRKRLAELVRTSYGTAELA